MDPTIQPGADFFSYTNGSWIKGMEMPDNKDCYDSFDQLREDNLKRLKIIFEKGAQGNWALGSTWQKLGDFYKSGLDTLALNAKGIEPIQREIDAIAAISNSHDFSKVIADLHKIKAYPLFVINVNPDKSKKSHLILGFYQGGLGLPMRSYYIDTASRSVELRDSYLEHASNIFALLGHSKTEADQNAQRVMDLETRLANAMLPWTELRKSDKAYQKVSLQEMVKICPQFDWQAYFKGIGIDAPDEMIVDNPQFFHEMGRIIASIDLSTWQLYLTWNLLNRYSQFMGKSFANEHFNFYGKKVSGYKSRKPRWEQVVQTANITLGKIVGQAYVEEFFPPQAKEKALELVTNLKKSFAERLSNSYWMSEQTKSQALEKLEKMNVKVGYPDSWKDYSALDIDATCYTTNIKKAMAFNFESNLQKLGKPIDNTEWYMNPQAVNAYYSPFFNELVFPAAILQSPFFSINADEALNYGAIGVIIAHEMVHGFDRQGRMFNPNGVYEDWWQPEDLAKFDELSQVLVEQYNSFVAINDMHLDGQRTLAENIADYGGLTIAYHALQRVLSASSSSRRINGFTPNQRFFLSYANIRKQIIRDQELIRRVNEDFYSPGRFRVNGALFNIPEFYEAFNIKETDPLYRAPEERPKIW